MGSWSLVDSTHTPYVGFEPLGGKGEGAARAHPCSVSPQLLGRLRSNLVCMLMGPPSNILHVQKSGSLLRMRNTPVPYLLKYLADCAEIWYVGLWDP